MSNSVNDIPDNIMDNDNIEGNWEPYREVNPDNSVPEPQDKTSGETDRGSDETQQEVEEKTEDTYEEQEQEEGEEGEKETKNETPKKGASKRIQELTAKYRNEQRQRQELEDRLAALEKISRNPEPEKSQQTTEAKPQAPDPANYEFGALDERYIEDTIQYKTSEALHNYEKQAQQKQQEAQEAAQQQKELDVIQTKASDLLEKGSKGYKDYTEVVLEAALKGEWPLERATFEAAYEAENGADILYELASDPAEAGRVAALSDTQQARYIFQKDLEFSKKKNPKVTQAPNPPGNYSRGASNRYDIAPDTDNLDEFEKLFYAKK